MRLPPKMQSYLPGLPSIENAFANYDDVTSDHIPILIRIDLPNTFHLKQIKIISWNVLQLDSGNGFSPNDRHNYKETDAQRNARYTRIALALAKFANNYQPQFITLQEITANDPLNNLHEKIKKHLGEQYRPVIFDGMYMDNGNCLTFYRADQFKPNYSVKNDPFNQIKTHRGGHTIHFTLLNAIDSEIRIANTHHKFSENTTHHEKSIEEFLKSETDNNKNTVLIMVGDFNGTIAPLHANTCNLTTSVSPACFRIEEGDIETIKAHENGIAAQGAWAIDGCFYSYQQKDATRDVIYCQQAESKQLNPRTGIMLTENEMQPSTTDLPDYQHIEMNKLRMHICVDEKYKQQLLPNGKTIYQFEKQLQLQLHDASIRVRHATNLKNKRGVSIVINKDLYQLLFDLNDNTMQLENKPDNINGFVLYIVYIMMNNFIATTEKIITIANQLLVKTLTPHDID